jgi:hypothetical protein
LADIVAGTLAELGIDANAQLAACIGEEIDVLDGGAASVTPGRWEAA